VSAALSATTEAFLELLRRRRCSPGSVIVDLGAADDGVAGRGPAGVGSATRALQAAGFATIGIAADQQSAERLTSMGAEVVMGDLSKPDDVFADVILVLGERHVAAVWLRDLPARVPDMGALVRAAHWFGEQTSAPLVLGVPNVTHVDVATRLLLGRWEPGQGGVSDDAHVRHFSPASLRPAMLALGWAEVDAADVEHEGGAVEAGERERSGVDAAFLERTTPVGAELAALRDLAGPEGHAEYLVRIYEPVMPAPVDADADGRALRAPFLSVLVRTQGKRWGTLEEALLCLAAQTCDDFEVLVMVHDPEGDATSRTEGLVAEFHPSFSGRVRVVEVAGGGRCRPLNEGARMARGRYLATLDDDDLVFAHWVETMREAAEGAPWHAVRVVVGTQQVVATQGSGPPDVGYQVTGRPRVDYPLTFDYVEHLRDNLTPNNGYAVPRSIVTDLGQGWDESLPVLEDWDHLLRSAAICGVESVPTVAAMIRVWANAENSKTLHTSEVWEETRQRIVAQHDAVPLLLDRGYMSKLRALVGRISAAEKLEQRNEELAADVGRLTGELADSERRREIADEAVDALKTARDDLQRRLDDVLTSRSWQLTQSVGKGVGRARRWAKAAEEIVRDRRGGDGRKES
jgi:hypothetical protein